MDLLNLSRFRFTPLPHFRSLKSHAEDLSEEAQEVYKYMYSNNRPMSALMVFDNMHERVKKGQVGVALDELADRGVLVAKLYGKSKIYHVNQDMYPADDAAAAAESGSAAAAIARARALKEEVDALNKEIAALEASPTDEQAQESLEKAQAENTRLSDVLQKARLASLSELTGGGASASAKGGAKATAADGGIDAKKRALWQYVREWRARRKACYDMMDVYLENVSKTRKVFMRELGVEPDEEAKIDIKEYIALAEEWGCHTVKK